MKTSKNQVVMPINVATMIDENDPVFKMAEIPEKLDYKKLHSGYRRRWRKIDPEVMFSIVVYANMRGIFSSRAIEEACKTDIGFMWLLQYEPDQQRNPPFYPRNSIQYPKTVQSAC